MSREPAKRTARLARILTAVVLILGAASTFIAARLSQARHDAEVRQVFETECSAMQSAVTRQLELFFDVLDSMSQLMLLSEDISGDELAEFTAKGLRFQKRILSSYGFVQRMPDPVRRAVERDPAGLKIVERTEDGAYIPADRRTEYYPLVYQFPRDSLGLPLGADIASLPGARDAIVAMNRRMGPVIASTIQPRDPTDRSGYFALSPIYQTTDDGRAAFSGFTLAILWPQQILKDALENVSARDVLVRFYEPAKGAPVSPGPTADVPSVRTEINVADRSWLFEAVASPEYLERHTSALPAVILAAGSIITVLATGMMMVLASRTRRIERVVRERTRDLEKSMAEQLRLEKEIIQISEQEKQQIGHDLHDSLGQKLTGAVFLSRAIGGHIDPSNTDAKEQADKITEILKDSVAQVRRMARGLSPVELGKEGLSGALSRLTEEVSTVYEISCLFHCTEEREPPAGTAHHLYAIAQEAVNNAVKHGKATEIVVELADTESGRILSIEDNGHGFDAGAARDTGMGLRIMHYRATMIDGSLDIARRDEGGMKITCAF